MPTLREALTGLDALDDVAATLHGRDDVVVTGASADSRTVRPGDIFVAVQGLSDDGHRHISAALTQGARAIVSERPPAGESDVPWVTVSDARAALGWLAASFHGFPARQLGLIGVTGTDGKTTTAHAIAAILEAAGWPAGLISTVEVRLGDELRPNDTNHTTPPANVLQGLLAEMVERRLRWVVLEVSSHALAQRRVAGCFFDIAAFTNLTPEHLNYHGDFAHYRDAKAELFAMLGREPKDGIPTFGVLNADDPNHCALCAGCTVEQLTYAHDAEADYRLRSVEHTEGGTQIDLDTPDGPVEVWTPLVGRYNAYNVAAASVVGLRLGIPPPAVARGLAEFRGVAGRLQQIEEGQPFQVVVDFAHTPHALRTVLTTLRAKTPGRLILVFGHPGGRDRQNRVDIARTAASLADLLILTSDDPYDEDPRGILAQLDGALREAGRQPGGDFLRIDERPAAIARAVELARPGDTVLISGRGHLAYTEIRGRKFPLSDAVLAREALQRLSVVSSQ